MQHSRHRYKSEPSTEASLSIYNKQQKISPIKLPKLNQRQTLSMDDVQSIGQKVLHLKKVCHEPNGCSKSLRLDRVLMLKKMNRIDRFMTELNKNMSQSVKLPSQIKLQSRLEKGLLNKYRYILSPQTYIRKVYL